MTSKPSHVVFIDEPAGHDELYHIIVREINKGTGQLKFLFLDSESWKNHVGDLNALGRLISDEYSGDENPLRNTEAYKLENLLINKGYKIGSSYDFSSCCVRYSLS